MELPESAPTEKVKGTDMGTNAKTNMGTLDASGSFRFVGKQGPT